MTRKPFKVQAVAHLLGTTVDSVRRNLQDAGIEVERQESGPKTRLFTVENLFQLAYWRAHERDKSARGVKSPIRRKVVATVYAPKGGVGKTTLASNLACLFQLYGARTLVADLDFQSNLTLAYGYDSELTREEALKEHIPVENVIEHHIGSLFPDWPYGRQDLRNIIKKPFGDYGPHLLPSDLTLDRLDTLLTLAAINGRKSAKLMFAELIANGRNGVDPMVDLRDYDIILFDAAPAKNHMTRNALMASDFVISPVSMEKFSTKSLSYLSDVLTEMRDEDGRNPELIIVGNFFDSNRVRVIAQMGQITEAYQGAWLEKTIRRSEAFPKMLTTNEKLPLALAKPTEDVAKEMQDVAKALLVRMGVFDDDEGRAR